MNATEQLQFIVKFANLDLRNQREGDWMNLQDDLRRFFPEQGTVEPRVTLFAVTDPELEKYPKPKIVSLQEDLRALLVTKAKLESMATVRIREIDVSLLPILGGTRQISGKFRDVFLLYLLILLLDEKASSRIRQCSVCEQFFFRVRRQVHCSPQCADKAAYEGRLNRQREKAKSKKKQRRKKK